MIREMEEKDAKEVLEIYKEAILEGKSTFTLKAPDWSEFNNAHLPYLRYVFEEGGEILGWVTTCRIYSAPQYDGYLEESIYIKKSARKRGIGTQLLSHLITESEKRGIWTLYGCIFSSNKASIDLHKKLGFRVIGERINSAKDRFGTWQSTTLVERRSSLAVFN